MPTQMRDSAPYVNKQKSMLAVAVQVMLLCCGCCQSSPAALAALEVVDAADLPVIENVLHHQHVNGAILEQASRTASALEQPDKTTTVTARHASTLRGGWPCLSVSACHGIRYSGQAPAALSHG